MICDIIILINFDKKPKMTVSVYYLRYNKGKGNNSTKCK